MKYYIYCQNEDYLFTVDNEDELARNVSAGCDELTQKQYYKKLKNRKQK